MAIAFVSAGTGAEAASGNVSPTMPATVNANDIAIIVWGSDDNVTASLPAGWTIGDQGNSSFTHGGWGWRRCDGSEDGASVTITHAAGGGIAARIYLYSGVVSSGNPWRVKSQSLNTTSDSSIEASSITPGAGDTVLLMGALGDIGTLSGYSGTDPTFTERGEFSGTGSNFTHHGVSDGTSSGAATGGRTITSTGTGPSVGWLVALMPELVFTHLTSGTATASSSPATASITPTANSLVLLSVSVYDAAARTQNIPIPTVTGCSLTWVLVGEVPYDNSGTDRSSVFTFRAMGSSPSSGTVTMSFGETEAEIAWTVSEISGASRSGTNGSGALAQIGTAAFADASSSGTVTLNTFQSASNAAWGVFSVQKSGTLTFTPGSGFSQLGTTQQNGTNSIAAEYQIADSDPNASWSATTLFRSGAVGVEVARQGFEGVPPPPPGVWIVP
jgi:hypothetical protein